MSLLSPNIYSVLLFMSSSSYSITGYQPFSEIEHLPNHIPGPESRRVRSSDLLGVASTSSFHAESSSAIYSRSYPVTQELFPSVRHRTTPPLSPLDLDESPTSEPSRDFETLRPRIFASSGETRVKLPSIHSLLAHDKVALPSVGPSTFAIHRLTSYTRSRIARCRPSASGSKEPHFLGIRTMENDLSTQDLINLAIVVYFCLHQGVQLLITFSTETRSSDEKHDY